MGIFKTTLDFIKVHITESELRSRNAAWCVQEEGRELGVRTPLRCPPIKPRGSLERWLVHSCMAAPCGTFTVTTGEIRCQLCLLEVVSAALMAPPTVGVKGPPPFQEAGWDGSCTKGFGNHTQLCISWGNTAKILGNDTPGETHRTAWDQMPSWEEADRLELEEEEKGIWDGLAEWCPLPDKDVHMLILEAVNPQGSVTNGNEGCRCS